MRTFRVTALFALVLLTVARASIGEGANAASLGTTEARSVHMSPRQTAKPQGATAAASAALPSIAYDAYTLPNGLKVILSQDRRLPLASVNLWYHVGPANEAEGRTGFAHLFEHMMFQASKHVPPDSHIRLLEGAGATDLNGTTDFDRTNYFETVPSNQIELALWLESDRMGYLLEKVTAASLANQQDVVRNERRQSVENEPYGIVEEALFHTLYPKGHPYYADVIGSHADIQAAKLEDVRAFFTQYYAPNNASLAIVGDFDPAAVKALVQKYFGTLKRGPAVTKPAVATPPITSERRLVVKDTVELPKVYMAWLTPSIYTPGDADAIVAADVLGGGKSSRLYKSLVYEKQIAQSVRAEQSGLILGSVFRIEAVARPGHTAEELEAAINTELDTLRTAGPDLTEVERARNGIETDIINGLQRLGGFGGVADQLNKYEHYLGDPGYLQKDLRRFQQTSPASVKAFAAAFLKNDARIVVHGVPGEKQLPPEVPKADAPAAASGDSPGINAEEAWRNEMPKAGPSATPKLPAPTKYTLSNGLTVLTSERKGLPIVSASLVVRTGSDANPANQPGLANFVAAMLDEGTATRSSLQIANDVAHLGATLSTGSSMDSTTVSVTSLTKNFPAALDILTDVALQPGFPAAEIDRQRASRLASLVQQRENPQQTAQKVLVAALYGPHHPYGFTEIGTEASNKAMTREALDAFWKQNFVPNNTALVVVGDLPAATVKTLAEKAFGAWARGTPATPALGAPETTAARLVVVDKPAAPQTQVWIGAIGAPRSAADYAAINVMNNGFGGLFSSRLNLNLREDKGYSYGAYSGATFRKAAGPMFALAGVRADVTAQALAEMLKEAEGMSTKPLSADELKLAIDALVRSLPGDFETNQNTVGSFASLFVYDLGLDYFVKYPALITSVDAVAAQAAAKKYLAADRLRVVAVGDTSKFLPELAKAGVNLGTPEVRDADGAKK